MAAYGGYGAGAAYDQRVAMSIQAHEQQRQRQLSQYYQAQQVRPVLYPAPQPAAYQPVAYPPATYPPAAARRPARRPSDSGSESSVSGGEDEDEDENDDRPYIPDPLDTDSRFVGNLHAKHVVSNISKDGRDMPRADAPLPQKANTMGRLATIFVRHSWHTHEGVAYSLASLLAIACIVVAAYLLPFGRTLLSAMLVVAGVLTILLLLAYGLTLCCASTYKSANSIAVACIIFTLLVNIACLIASVTSFVAVVPGYVSGSQEQMLGIVGFVMQILLFVAVVYGTVTGLGRGVETKKRKHP